MSENHKSGELSESPQRVFVAELRTMKEAGLTFGECVAAFGDDQQDPFVLAAREFHHKDGEVEIDDVTVVSRGDDPGAYVLAWIWVDKEEAVSIQKMAEDANLLPDPLGCRACCHPDCGRFNGPRQIECSAMADNACARPTAERTADSLMFRNFYTCPDCKHEWADEWPATCDDDCPNCGKRHISPVRSEDVEEVRS